MPHNLEEFEHVTGLPVPEESGEAVHIHEHQQSVVSRLARIEGHVRGVKRMVEQGQPCPDILVQIAALRSALNGVGRIILEDHLQECMVRAVRQGDLQTECEALARSLDMFIR